MCPSCGPSPGSTVSTAATSSAALAARAGIPLDPEGASPAETGPSPETGPSTATRAQTFQGKPQLSTLQSGHPAIAGRIRDDIQFTSLQFTDIRGSEEDGSKLLQTHRIL